MAQYNETHIVNLSAEQTTVANEQTIVSTIELAANSLIELTLTGVTRDSAAQPLGDVTVVAYDINKVAVAQTVSNTTTGAYTLVIGGNIGDVYSVVATKTGYYDAKGDVTFVTNTATKDFTLYADGEVKAIYGTVTDDQVPAVPVAGALVTISDTNGNIVTVTTGIDGSYLAYDNFLEGVEYTVTARKIGYTESSQNVTIAVGTDSGVANLVLAVQSSNFTNIVGNVVEATTLTPIADALVGLYLVTGGTQVLQRTTKTDAQGGYSFSGVTGGATYIVRAVKIVSA